MKRDWAAIGIRWDDGIVKTDEGQKTHRATIPTFVDYDKLAEHLGKGRIVGLLNASNSPRVAVQEMNRTASEKGHGFEWVQERFYLWLTAQRATAQMVHLYPDGEKYFGTDEQEYRATYAAKLTDMGVDGAKALDIATTGVKW